MYGPAKVLKFTLTVAPDETLYVGGSFPNFELASQQGFASFFGDRIFADGFEGRP